MSHFLREDKILSLLSYFYLIQPRMPEISKSRLIDSHFPPELKLIFLHQQICGFLADLMHLIPY